MTQKQRNTEKNYPYSAPGRWRRNSRVDKVLPLSGLTAAPAKSPICSDSGLQRKNGILAKISISKAQRRSEWLW